MKFFFIFALLFSLECHAVLSDSVCANMVVTNLKTINGPIAEPQAIQYWTQICKGILDHIKASALVGPFPAGTLKDSVTNAPITGETGTATGVIQ